MEKLIDIEQAAKELSISPWTVRFLIRSKKLVPVKVGRRTLLEPGELDRFVQSCKDGTA
jgi:excisionase family DNA binding protein